MFENKDLDFRTRLYVFISIFVPALFTALTDLDIGQFATYIVAASLLGFGILPILGIVYFFCLVINSVNGRINIVTNKGLIELIRERYGIVHSVVLFIFFFFLCIGIFIQAITGLKLVAGLLGYNEYIFIVINYLFIFLIISFRFVKNIKRLFIFVLMFYGAIITVSIAKIISSKIFLDFPAHKLLPDMVDYQNIPFIFLAVLGATVTPWTLLYISRYTYSTKLNLNRLTYFKLENHIVNILLFVTSSLLVIGALLSLNKANLINNPNLITGLLDPISSQMDVIVIGSGIAVISILILIFIPLTLTYIYTEFFGGEKYNEEELQMGFGNKLVYLFLGGVSIAAIYFFKLSLFQTTLFIDFVNGLFLLAIIYFLYNFANNKGLMGVRYKNNLVDNVTLWIITLFIICSFILVLVFKIITVFI